jgi:hypothetical protein
MKVILEIDAIGFDFSVMEKVGNIIDIPCMPSVGMFIDIGLYYEFTDEEYEIMEHDGMCKITDIYIEPDCLRLQLERAIGK